MYSNLTSFSSYDWVGGDEVNSYYTGGDYYYSDNTGITDRETAEINSPDFTIGGGISFTKQSNSSYGNHCSLSRESSDSGCYDTAYHGINFESRNQGLLLSTNLSQTKCRQLPCRTFISTGSCPYGERCVFLHDLSIVSRPIYIRSKVRDILVRYIQTQIHPSRK